MLLSRSYKMTRIAVIGGKLQGTEICYLAKKAGIDTTLIDKNSAAPARGLATKFMNIDILNENNELITELLQCDLVVPALENEEVLNQLLKMSKKYKFILAFDEKAYEISSSKLKSDRLFHENILPSPAYFPEGRAPYICKPVFGSGSVGVRIFDSATQVKEFLEGIESEEDKNSWIIQEFVTGPAYSIEVIGSPSKGYKTYQITEILTDDKYDCNKVNSFTELDDNMELSFRQLGIKLAELVKLNGIMDVEVILNGKELKLLEIDARFPSQTPTVVFQSTGENLIVEVITNFCENTESKAKNSKIKGDDICKIDRIENEKYVTYEHFLIANGKVSQPGEHIMAAASYLEYLEGFCNADEALTDFKFESSKFEFNELTNNKFEFRCTMINKADSIIELNFKRAEMLLELEKLGRAQNER
jgi:3-methylornithine--L-lysine ligase